MSETEHYAELQAKSSSGIKWQGISEIIIRLFQLLTMVILARLLEPSDFGLITIALIFTQLVYVIFDFGLSSSLVQKKDCQQIHYSTVFMVYLAASIFFAVLIILFAQYIAAFFSQPDLEKVLSFLTIVLLGYALNAIPQVLLLKNLKFKKLSQYQMIATFGYGLVTILFAWLGHGIFSFVYGIITEQFCLFLLLALRTKWRPKMGFSGKALKDIIGFGSNVMGTRIVGYINANSANFIIGKFLGSHILGFYTIAYQIIDFPVQRIAKNVLKVMFPVLSKTKNEDDFKKLYKKTIYHLGLLLLPLFMGILLISDPFIRLVFGDKWIAAIVPLQILTFVGLARSFWTTTSMVFLAKGTPRTEFKINLGFALVLIPTLVIMSKWGMVPVLVSMAVLIFSFLVIAELKALQLSKISVSEFLKLLTPSLIGSVSFLISCYFIDTLILHQFTLFIRLGVLIVIATVQYAFIIYLFDRKILERLSFFIKS